MSNNQEHKPRPANRADSDNAAASSPLSRFLEDIFGEQESRLAKVATEMAEQPFDATKFREELVQKLQRLQYPQPPERETHRPTFYDRLQRADCTEAILEGSTLQEIWRCLLIPRIVGRDRELQRLHLSAVGYPVNFHRTLYREAEKRLRMIEDLVEEFGTTGWMEEYRRQVERQFRENAILYLLSRRDKGKREELLSGQPRRQLSHAPRDEQLAAKVAVYWILWTRLHRKEGMSNRFLRQLSLLINAPLDVTQLESDEALRKALASDELGWRNLLEIPSKK